MTRLAASDLAAVTSFGRELDNRAVDGVASAAALDAMLALVRADTIEWGISDAPTRRIVEIRHYPPLLVLRGSDPYVAAVNEQFWAAQPHCPLCGNARIRKSGAIKVSEVGDMSLAHPQHFVCAGIPVVHQINLFMRPGDILTRHVAFSRAEGLDFDERDRQVLELAGLFIVQQSRMAEARDDASVAIAAFEATGEPSGRGLIVVRGGDRPAFVSVVARHLLERYFGWTATSRRLPLPVERWLGEVAYLERGHQLRGSSAPLIRVNANGELMLRTVTFDGQVVVILDEQLSPANGARSLLTAREREILDAVADGLTNGQIGERLWLSSATVGKHLENIFAKLGVHSRAGAVARARGLMVSDQSDRVS